MDGIIVINKPSGMTSFDVIKKIRKLTGIKKIGHTGTLDPDAQGVLPVCIGRATACVEFLMDKDKKYIAEMTLGSKTDTQDHTGRIIASSDKTVTEEEIFKVLEEFVGEQQQMPPMYSAVKIQGKKLYELARQGRKPEEEIKPRKIIIYSISNVNFIKESGIIKKVRFEVHCSKGTYIRTLCHDIGERLGCYAYMSSLLRTQAGDFSLEKSYTLEEVEKLYSSNELSKALIPCDYVFSAFGTARLQKDDVKRFINGVPVKLYRLGYRTGFDSREGELVRIYSREGVFIGLAKAARDEKGFLLKPYKLFIRRDEYDFNAAQ